MELERTGQDTRQEIQMNKRQEIEKMRSKASSKYKAEQMKDCMTKSLKKQRKMEHKKTEEAVNVVKKENDLWKYENEKEEAKKIAGRQRIKKDEEMVWAPPRSKSDWPDWGEARSVEKSVWRLEPEGETEVPEIIVVSDAGESTHVDLGCKSHHEQAEANISRREREVPGEEGEEIKSPKRKVIRVESEETQDYVREAKSAEQEEVEERNFVPSAVSVRCLLQCADMLVESVLNVSLESVSFCFLRMRASWIPISRDHRPEESTETTSKADDFE